MATGLRAAVIGLGMMGRHHARVLQSIDGVEFAGAVDPLGDRYGVVRDRHLVFPAFAELVAHGMPDFAVIAVPTEEHVCTVREAADAGVHVLVEKPLAATYLQAAEIIDICARARVRGAVGHIERFNPALLELRRRALDGQLGELFLIATERTGPFPSRVKDVGVVKDLATHDLDLVQWLGGAPVEMVAAQTSHRIGRGHEDLVLATGRLSTAVTFNCVVDWLTPTKTRRTRILGERGMLVADTLTADLTFFENGDVRSEWDAQQQLKGVSEGLAIRYPLNRREPLLVEIEAFLAHIRGDEDAPVVSLHDGSAVVRFAEAVLESAERGETVRVDAGVDERR
jgi:UDP-N-acetylglucosamine 3-dehydrogenase